MKWRRKSNFHKAYCDLLQKLFDSALVEAQSKLGKALGWIDELHRDLDFEINNATTADDRIKYYNAKMKAAVVLINSSFKSHELAVLKKELAKLRHLKDLVNQLMAGGGTTAPAAAFSLTAACESDCSAGQDDSDTPAA